MMFDNNPGSLVSYEPYLMYDDVLRQRTPEFCNYACQSDFARFYQLVARGGAPTDALRIAFLALPDAIRNALSGRIWVDSHYPATDDPQWGEHHAFDNMNVFCRVLNAYVRASYGDLSTEQRTAVHFHVYDLARRLPGAEVVNFDSPNWGAEHAQEHVLRLIDAMMRVQFGV
jgi:hypothetical protein